MHAFAALVQSRFIEESNVYYNQKKKVERFALPSFLTGFILLCYNGGMKKKIIIPITILLSVLVLLGGGMGIYFASYYKAKISADILCSDEEIQVLDHDDYLAFLPKAGYQDGLIFYQGAKVDEKAYAPMLRQIARQGILCFLVKMPLNFALFDTDAAEEIVDDFDGSPIDWYVGGHSLGGSMAATCANDNPFLFKGVVLFASYSTKSLTHTQVLSIYGDKDGVLNWEKYKKNKANLPPSLVEVEIKGGNHANFGYYGEQKGDGKATLSREQQIDLTVNAVRSFIIGDELA